MITNWERVMVDAFTRIRHPWSLDKLVRAYNNQHPTPVSGDELALIKGEKVYRDYCRYCNERLIHKDGVWLAVGRINPHSNHGDPKECYRTGTTHDPR